MIKEIPFNLIFLGYFNINFIFLCHFNRNNINFFLLGDSIRFTWLKDPIYVPVGHLRRQAASDWFRPCHAPYWGKCINPPHFQPTQPPQAQNPGTRVCNCRLEWGTRVNRGQLLKRSSGSQSGLHRTAHGTPGQEEGQWGTDTHALKTAPGPRSLTQSWWQQSQYGAPHFDGIEQGCGNSRANALELP